MTTRTQDGETAVEILELIGKAAMIALAENFGGTRLYVATNPKADSDLVAAIGVDAAKLLSARFAPDIIRVPLSRELRATHYRHSGLSNAKIATRLGVTESSVNRMFRRLADEGVIVRP